MNHFILILFSFFSLSIFAQTQLKITQYPAVQSLVEPTAYDWTESEDLKVQGLVRKALEKVQSIQNKAAAEKNIREFWLSCTEIDKLLFKVGFDANERELFVWKQAEFVEKVGFPLDNIAHYFLGKWIQQLINYGDLRSDEESLVWKVGDSSSQLHNDNFDDLLYYHQQLTLARPEELMKISIKQIQPPFPIDNKNRSQSAAEEQKHIASLFEYFAFKEAHRNLNLRNRILSDSTFFGLTARLPFASEFLSSEYFAFQLYYHIENACLKNNRLEDYSFFVDKRLSLAYEIATFEKVNNFDKDKLKVNAYKQVESFLIKSPASARFSYYIADEMVKDGLNYHWQNNRTPRFKLTEANKKIESALLQYPNSEFAEDLLNLKKHIAAESFDFSFPKPPLQGQELLLHVDYRNVVRSVLKVYKIEDIKSNHLDQNPLKKYQLKALYKQDLLFDKDVAFLPHDKDFILPKLKENGAYLFVTARSEKEIEELLLIDSISKMDHFVFKVFDISSISVMVQDDKGKSTFFVTDAKTGQALSHAQIKIKPGRNYQKTNERDTIIYTNENGLAEAKMSTYYSYTVHVDKDSVSGTIYSYYYGEAKKKECYSILTDRAIYRPGQTLQFKLIAFQKDGTDAQLEPGKKVSIILKDRNEKQVAHQSLITNIYGSASGILELPMNGFLLGQLSLSIDGKYQRSIRVEEYKRPTFEVVLNELDGNVKIGDSVTIVGKVMAYAGYPIANATVSIEILQHNYFPRWSDVPYDERSETIFIDALADVNGEFHFNFLPKRGKYMYGSQFSINAQVVDPSGEVQEAERSVYIGNEAYTMEIDIQNTLLSNHKNELVLRVNNSQEVEQKEAMIHFSLVEINPQKWFIQTINQAEFKAFTQKQFEKKFPHIRYFEYKKNELIDTVIKGSTLSGKPLDVNTIIGSRAGHFELIASTIDPTKEKIVLRKEFNYVQLSNSKDQHLQEFWVANTNPQPKVGDELSILLGSSFKKLPVLVHCQTAKGENTYEWITLKSRKKLNYTIDNHNKEGFALTFLTMKDGVSYKETQIVNVNNPERELNIQLQSKRDFLKPGTKESWSVLISDVNGKNGTAELAVAMYDESLDKFISNDWHNTFYSPAQFNSNWRENSLHSINNSMTNWEATYLSPGASKNYLRTSLFSLNKSGYGNDSMILDKDASAELEEVGDVQNMDSPSTEETQKSNVPRSNFNETAFFYPNIYADTSGNYRFEFTLPDALTRWKFLSFAHTKELKAGQAEYHFEARKEVMIQANAPRFFREGDRFVFSSKAINLTDSLQQLEVRLKLIDPLSEQDVSASFGQLSSQKISLSAKETREIHWELNIPVGSLSMVAYIVEAVGDHFSDAEKKALPILSNRQLITESKPFVKTTVGEQTFSFDRMDKLSPNAEKISLTLELQTQPLWTAVMSLPYLMEYPYECAEQIFSRYYANSLAQKIIKDNPAFQVLINTWKTSDPAAFLSELEKNPELKNIVLTETPWLLEAQNESTQRHHLFQLFNENQLNQNILSAGQKLNNLLTDEGAWSWFGKGVPNLYITQYILNGLGQMKQIGLRIDDEQARKAMAFLENHYNQQFLLLKKEDLEQLRGLGEAQVQWLVARSYFDSKQTDASRYYQKCLSKQWKNFSLYTQAMAGMSVLKEGDRSFAEMIKNALIDRSTTRPDMGMYWNENKNGMYWNQSAVETQSAIIRFFVDLGNLDAEIGKMQVWLLQQKRATAWETTKATTNACHALVLAKAKENKSLQQSVSLRMGDGTNLGVLLPTSANTFRWTGQEITPNKAKAIISTTTQEPVFGAFHVQYLEEIDKILKSDGDIRLERHYYWINQGKEEEVVEGIELPAGTKVKVKLTVTTNRTLEFVHLKDGKASGVEARETLSGYHYSTVSYYQISKDASTEFFIENLPKGSHTFEYEVFFSAKGKLSVGSAIVECMYAPAFRANSKGTIINVK